MSNIVEGDPLIKRNETKKSSKSDEKKSKNSDNLPKRNHKKSKNKQKNKNPEPQILQLDSENGPSSSKPGPSSSNEIEITTLAPSESKKISKTVDKESSGYGIIWGRAPTYTLIIFPIFMVNENC